MGRDEILQPTRFKALKCNHPKKRALKLLNATTLKNALSSLKINHKIPIPTI
ncbi:hypothetical protein OUQ_0199 [Helicobacter pylori R055a]|nr:hypothetical protein OUQ_0199 [Helicobacter pylori R055a]